MWNLNDIFQSRAPGRDVLADRLMNNPRGVSNVVPVARSLAPQEFFNRVDELPRGIVLPGPAYGLGSLSGQRFLGGLGAATTAATDFLPGMRAGHQWTLSDFTGGAQVDAGDIRPGGGSTQGRQWAENMRAAIDANNSGKDWCLTGTSGYRGIAYSGPYTAMAAAQAAWSYLNDGAIQAEYPNLPAKVAEYDAAIRAALNVAADNWDGVLSGLPPCGRIQFAAMARRRVAAFETLRQKLDAVISLAKSVKDDKTARDAKQAETDLQNILSTGSAKDAGVSTGEDVLNAGGSVNDAANAAAEQAASSATAGGATAAAALKAAADAKAAIIAKYSGGTTDLAVQSATSSGGLSPMAAAGIALGGVAVIGLIVAMKRKKS